MVKATAVVLRRLREHAEISQEELAARAGLSRSMIDKSERRKRLPSLDVVMKIASGLETEASEIVRLIEQELNDSAAD
ncbi:MAG: helix-turn-helix transcriptional regulator [Balneolaceae bacterium]